MKMLAFLMTVVCVIVAVTYYLVPGGSLPAFMPGYDEGSTHIHRLHAVAAVAGAAFFLLIGLSMRR
jgi:hypothetical protein